VYTRLVELSHSISPKIPLCRVTPMSCSSLWPTWAKDCYFLRKFSIGEHSATHMNAPNSFIAGNKQAITSYKAEQRVVPAVVIDIRDNAVHYLDYQLTKTDVLDWEAQYGRVAPGSFVILFTGWQHKWDQPKAFINQDADGNLHFPGFRGSSTKWLLVGSPDLRRRDRHAWVDPGLDTSYATNTQIAEAHKIDIECMANLDKLPPTGATLLFGPLQLRGGSGSPMSVMALVP
jgi:kynurenine formamidase